ncbi:hypothetical protein NFI95_00115 [Acetobacteraceae bacterium KSS8]|uniref:Uncharacterized protein n=1 Tax=Endosaccharibacter trunci TaxID=2812733 RepID=A0ABT1W1V9_9PROT|nr:hypothetical protein [Acetobacteraceae bacterium KSS8]
MPDNQASEDDRLLRAIRRRRMAGGPVISVPILAGWWLLSGWIARRYAVQPELVQFSTMLAFLVLGILAPRWLEVPWFRDPRETPRIRWLIQEGSDRYERLSRLLLSVGLGGLLLVQCVSLVNLAHPTHELSDGDGVGWAVFIALLGVRWRPSDLGDEGAQLRYLIAAHRAFLVTVILCLAAVVADSFHAGLLRPAISAALLAGALTLQLSLMISERRTAPDAD